jgi:hypothetical protein
MNAMGMKMNDEVQMLIQCLTCLQCWDIDHDPESCTCATDADWTLIVVSENEEQTERFMP